MNNTLQDSKSILEQHVIKETAQSFSKKVEDLVWQKDVTYFEAVQTLLEENDLETEGVKKLLTADVLAKLTQEAEDLRLIKRTQTKLF